MGICNVSDSNLLLPLPSLCLYFQMKEYIYIWSEGFLFLCGLEVWGIIPMSRLQPKTNDRWYINIPNSSPLGWDKSEACVLHHFPDSPSWIKLQLPRWELLNNIHLIGSTPSMSYFLTVLVFPGIIFQIN